MAAPISLSLPQYVDANGTPYNGAVLKAYAAGTTTNILMYTDTGAGTSFTDIALNASGYPEYSGSMVIPHVSENYKLALYADQAAADANTPAIWAIDGLIPLTISGTFVTNDAVSNASTNVLSITHTTTGTPVNGIGVGQSFSAETSNGNTELGMVLETVATDVTAGSEDFDFVVKLMAGGSAAAEKFRVKSTGLIDINGAVQIDGTLTVGVDDTGYDVQFFGATSGKSLLWDESADTLNVTGTVEFDALKGTGAITITNILDEDNMSSNSATALATQQSIKAYVDSSVGAADSWAESLAVAVTSGANSPSVASGQALLTNTINETTAASGVTIDSVLLKDNTVLAGTLLLGAGSVTDSSGAITFGNENLTTTGTLGSGAITSTGTSLAAKLGVGIALTEGTLHVHTATAGSVTANANADDLVVENSATGGISILVPDASQGGIYFGSPTDTVGAYVTNTYSTGAFAAGSGKVGATFALAGDNAVTNLTLSGASGSELATFAGDVTLSEGKVVITDTANEIALNLTSSASTAIAALIGTSSNNHSLQLNSSHATGPYGLNVTYTGTAPNGVSSQFLYCADTVGVKFEVRSNGGIANFSANDVNLSDERAKKNIAIRTESEWDCVSSWEIVDYNYKEAPADAPLNIGVIAQQIQEHCPELVSIWQEAADAVAEELDDEGNVVVEAKPAREERLGVNEAQMMWKVTKALQEAMERIEALEAKLAVK